MIDLHLHHDSLLYVLKHQRCPIFIVPDQSYSHFSNLNSFTATHVIFTKCLKDFTATQKIHLKNATENVSVTFIQTDNLDNLDNLDKRLICNHMHVE